MYVPCSNSLCTTHMLLNDYARCDAHRLWGFHLRTKYTSGFSQTVPTYYWDHKSQIARKQNAHHFALRLLYVCTVNEVVNQQDIADLFSSFAGTNVYSDIQKHVRSNAINFQELHLTSSSLGNGVVYAKFLVETAKLIEEKVNEISRCRVAAALGPIFMRKLLKIMKSGLKNELSKQSDSTVKKTLNK
ncbi:hypothetical protein RMATCC62417_14218 [Rhizopus microsporus]|nr:hypothetical protein RMATCC62417_14218 [Rhizopus microsporus]